MTGTNTLFLYVDDVAASARFYTDMLEIPRVDTNPVFVMLTLPSGLALGLWQRAGVAPAPRVAGGGSEIGFKLNDPAAIDRTHAAWAGKGATIALPPTELGFGRSFVAVDPDGHRVRFYTVTAQ